MRKPARAKSQDDALGMSSVSSQPRSRKWSWKVWAAFAGTLVFVAAVTVGVMCLVRMEGDEVKAEMEMVPKSAKMMARTYVKSVPERKEDTDGAENNVNEGMLAALKSEKYYLEKNLDRYLAYAAANPELAARDVVRNVNSNLDHTRYVDVKNADLSYGVLAMINKYNYLGTYEPENLEYLGDGYTNSTAPMMRHEAAEAFRKMADAARAEGLTLMNISGYRSYGLQDWLYETYAAQDGYALADTYSSRPGYSEHQAGLATDINSVEVSFANTAEYRWLQVHAADYGFIMRYPEGLEYITGFSYEPWHYRYVGTQAAQQIVREGLTFDEYYAYYVER